MADLITGMTWSKLVRSYASNSFQIRWLTSRGIFYLISSYYWYGSLWHDLHFLDTDISKQSRTRSKCPMCCYFWSGFVLESFSNHLQTKRPSRHYFNAGDNSHSHECFRYNSNSHEWDIMFLEGKFVIRRSDRLWDGLGSDLVLMRSLKSRGGLTRGSGLTDNQSQRATCRFVQFTT